tara:strand:- start:352 stop:867 length:516 start_codon:yes stop_codon:yes gene_type:complete
MKLLLENWRKYLNEEEDLLEEGWKDWLLAAVMGLSVLTAPISSASAAPPETTTQIQKASYTDNLSAEDKIILRGALYLFTIMDDKLSDDQKQGILKAAWILQVSKDASAETDKYLKAAWATIQNDGPELKKTYKQFGGKYKVLQRIKKGYVRTSGKGTQRHEITTYEWANR